MHRVRLPSLAENVNEATLAHWLVEPGDAVDPGTPLAELITEKAEFTLQAQPPVRGRVQARLASPGSVLPVGYILCLVGPEADEEAQAAAEQENRRLLARKAQDLAGSLAAEDASPQAPHIPAVGAGVRATPAARRLARELGLDLADVAAVGAAQPLREQDVRTFAEEQGHDLRDRGGPR